MGRSVHIKSLHHDVMKRDGIGKLTSNKGASSADTPGKPVKARISTSDPNEGRGGSEDCDKDMD